MMPTLVQIDNLETLLGNGSFGPLVKQVCAAARRGVEVDAMDKVFLEEYALHSDPIDCPSYYDGCNCTGVEALRALFRDRDNSGKRAERAEAELAKLRVANTNDASVPRWITAWPDWYETSGNVEVVPAVDYEHVMIERNAMRLNWQEAQDDRNAAVARERDNATRLEALHSKLIDDEGYEWGIARIKWDEHGNLKSALWTASDHSDLDALIRARVDQPEGGKS